MAGLAVVALTPVFWQYLRLDAPRVDPEYGPPILPLVWLALPGLGLARVAAGPYSPGPARWALFVSGLAAFFLAALHWTEPDSQAYLAGKIAVIVAMAAAFVPPLGAWAWSLASGWKPRIPLVQRMGRKAGWSLLALLGVASVLLAVLVGAIPRSRLLDSLMTYGLTLLVWPILVLGAPDQS